MGSSPTHIQVRADETGLLCMKQTPEAAAKVSALLQEDLEVCNKRAKLLRTLVSFVCSFTNL